MAQRQKSTFNNKIFQYILKFVSKTQFHHNYNGTNPKRNESFNSRNKLLFGEGCVWIHHIFMMLCHVIMWRKK